MKTFCPNCEKDTECEFTAELYECKECGEDFAKYIVSRKADVSDVSMTQDVSIDIKTPQSIENTNPDYYKQELARRDEIIARLKEDGERLWNIADTYSLGGGCMGCKLEGIPSPENVWGHTPDCPITLHRALMKELEC